MTLIVSWNVNSIRVRLEHLVQFLKNRQPDIMLLQELKAQDDVFPYDEIQNLGYNAAIHGQKTYNGVAILSKLPISNVVKGLPGDDEDLEARYIEALCGPYHVASVYVPNGQEVGSEKYQYKLKFYERLYTHLQQLLRNNDQTIIGGDYNVAPYDIDVYDPEALGNQILCSTAERNAFRKLLHLGYYDSFRAIYPNEQSFSWWDYRAGAWPKNEGLRIDHLLLSPKATDGLLDTGIDKEMRAATKASDHAPVWCKLV
ncbi:MAG: exodeoxyribonuclease III [Alphaproteobacteria bacterium]|nr:exodeoxyribonuclease III [Alphaproteobacteria bacterium]